jgi:hypothetical protein
LFQLLFGRWVLWANFLSGVFSAAAWVQTISVRCLDLTPSRTSLIAPPFIPFTPVDDTAPVLIRESRQVSTAEIGVAASAAGIKSQSLNVGNYFYILTTPVD